MLGLGYLGEKDFSAFISEVIPGNPVGSGKVKQRRERNQAGVHCQAITTKGSWSSIIMGIVGESIECNAELSCQRDQGVGVLINQNLYKFVDIGGRGHSFPGTLSLPNSRQRVS